MAEVPQLLLRAKDMVPAFESLAEERKMDFEAYWIPGDQAVSSIRHPGQPEVNFTWTHLTADSLDEEGERFEDFVRENSWPAVMLVKEPKKTMKMLEGHQDALLLWLVLNSAKEAPCEETCSASRGASAPPAQALEDALAPWRRLLQETRQVYQAAMLRPCSPGRCSTDELALWLAEQLVRSAPIPEEQTSPVLTVVGANFRQVLYAPLARGQHVMLKVYAPWCGHCKKLAPIYEDFARKMQNEGRDLVLAELDAEANGIPFDGFDYTGFPTIFYLSPESAEIQKVQARSLDSLQRFVQKMQIPSSKAKAQASQPKPSMESLLSQFRSEEPPSVQTSPVLTVVLRNFIEVVFHQRRHCILMLHDQKCPHCKQMMPKLEAFARELGDAVFVAKMDGKLNDLPVSGFEVKGYPTLFFIEAGQKEPSFQQIGSNAIHAMRRFMEGKGLLRRQVEREL